MKMDGGFGGSMFLFKQFGVYEGQEKSAAVAKDPDVIAENIPGITYLVVADIDLDDDLDILALSETDSSILWIPNPGKDDDFDKNNEVKTIYQNASMINSPRHFTSADFDDDGDDDLAVASDDGNFTLLMNLGDASFSEPQIVYPLDEDEKSPGVFIDFADFDQDGNLDIVAASRGDSPAIRVFFQDSDTKLFGNPWEDDNLDSSPSSIVHLDMNSDGYPELFVAMPGHDRTFIYENEGVLRQFKRTAQDLLVDTFSVNHLSLIESNQDKDLIEFKITGGKDKGLFNFDSNYSGHLLFRKAPDFESPMDTEQVVNMKSRLVFLTVNFRSEVLLLKLKMRTNHR